MAETMLRAPSRMEQLTGAWVGEALASRGLPGVSAVEVLEVMHGTATKVRLGLTWAAGAGGPRPATLWAKAGFEAHSKVHEEVYAGEVNFYNTLVQTLTDITARCFYADRDPQTGASILLLDDLLPRGARFCDILEPLAPDAVASALSMIADYHSRHWMSEDLAKDRFLTGGGSYMAADVLGRKFAPETLDRLTRLPRWEVLPKSLHDTDRMRDAFYALQRRWMDPPYCLNHGDAHVGQAYRYPDGRFGLLDWQCAKLSNWAQDVAYFLVSALSVDDRRRCEDDLLAHYLAELVRRGAQPPAFAEARDALRLHVLHGLGWSLCAPELQPEENCTTLTERFGAAVLDYGTIDRLLATD
jgi:Ecdysteroid kinase-like family